MTELHIPESFQHRPYAKRRFAIIANWARANHPFYMKHAADPSQPFPILTRAVIQADNELLLNGSPVTGRTSGSTSTPVEISWAPPRERIDKQDSARLVAMMGGPLPNMKIVSTVAHKKDESTIDVATPIPEQVEFILRRQAAKGACSLVTYPTNVEMLCKYIVEHGLDMGFMRRVTCLSEVYEPYHDKLIAQAFPNAVAHCTYSSVETGLIATRCPINRENYHISAHKLGVEFLDPEGRPCRDGEPGQVVITDYFNRRSTLIRYALGDLAAPTTCNCGLSDLPAMTNIIGKVRGVLKDPTGRPVIFTHLSPMFRDSPEIGQFQVVQEALDRFIVRYVPRRGADIQPFLDRVKARFVGEFGAGTTIAFEDHPEIPRSAGGKYHAAICLV